MVARGAGLRRIIIIVILLVNSYFRHCQAQSLVVFSNSCLHLQSACGRAQLHSCIHADLVDLTSACLLVECKDLPCSPRCVFYRGSYEKPMLSMLTRGP